MIDTVRDMELKVCTCRRLYSVIWRTECPGVRRACESPVFSLEESDWCFESTLEPNDFEETDLWQIYLKKLSVLEGLSGFQITTYMEDRRGKLERIDCTKLTFTGPTSVCISSSFASQVLDRKHDLMVDDMFTLVFIFDRPTMSRKNSWRETHAEKAALSKSACMESLSLDLSRLLDERLYPDLELRCEGQTILAHRAVLSARSEVFEAMLQADMLESRTGSIEIVDMEPDVLRLFLRYLYAGTLSEMSVDAATRLYEASDKYAVAALKRKCGEYLAENLTHDNACPLLEMADAHYDHALKDQIVCYLVAEDIPLTSDEWPRFSEEYPKLANEVLYRAYKTKCSPK